jgi:MFS transporter, putative metabolite:H+ symporter
MDTSKPLGFRAAFNAIVVVAALGYFVDIYDLILFGVVRVSSLKSIGITDDADIMREGLSLINWQMFGMLVGGVVWGILGDKRGRVTVLFGSILLYSLANIANGVIESFDENALLAYKILRFVAGFGLAGELGAGITLVSETMHKKDRGYGTMLMVMIGALGGVAAATVGNSFGWQSAYFIGGGLGLTLLIMRVGTYESGLFQQNLDDVSIERGNFFKLFDNFERFRKYLACILVGIPIWFSVGILVLLAKEFAKIIHVNGIDDTQISSVAIVWLYMGLAVGDIVSGLLSQWWQSRKKVILLFILLHAVSILMYVFARDISGLYYRFLIFFIGATTGYWGLFATIASEQFGTNLRATVATTVPNFVRGGLIIIAFAFEKIALQTDKMTSAIIVGMTCIAMSIFAINSLKETFGKDLDYWER